MDDIDKAAEAALDLKTPADKGPGSPSLILGEPRVRFLVRSECCGGRLRLPSDKEAEAGAVFVCCVCGSACDGRP